MNEQWLGNHRSLRLSKVLSPIHVQRFLEIDIHKKNIKVITFHFKVSFLQHVECVLVIELCIPPPSWRSLIESDP